jgi:hypothetical protein
MPLSDREALRSLLDVSKQLTSVMTHSNTAVQRQSLTDSDILIQPALGSISALDFQRWPEAVEAGEAAARAAVTALRPLAVAPERQTATVSAERAGFRAPVVVDSVRVVGATGVPAATLRGLIRVRAGDPVDPAVLGADLLRLHGLRLFGRVHVRIVVDEDRLTLEFEPKPRPGGASSLRFGLGFEDDYGAGTSRFHILSSLWLRQVNRHGGELRLDLQAGEPRGAAAELFQPLAPGSPVFLTGAEHRLGREVRGGLIFNDSMEWERSCILAGAVGGMRRQLEEAVRYASEREQFGQRIGAFQAVSHRLADMKVRLEATRLLLYRATWAKQRGHRDAAALSALAKLHISESCVQNSMDALRVRVHHRVRGRDPPVGPILGTTGIPGATGSGVAAPLGRQGTI